MKTYKNLYPKLCSYRNLELAFKKASRGKNKKFYVIEFKKNLNQNLIELQKELKNETYKPSKLKKFTIRDPKTRLIRKSIFKDRIVHHAIVNILEPIYEPRFIEDNYANRLNKGTILALEKLDKFKRKVSSNGNLVRYSIDNNMVKGHIFKADIKKFFDSINQSKMIEILERKIKDKKVIWLVIKIIKNFDDRKKGMPLGNMTSQFFANVYMNDLDQFVKRKLKMKYYIRYVDDFVILHRNREVLENCKKSIEKYLKNLRLNLHPDKSKIYSFYRGIDFLGFKTFYHHRRARKRNVKSFKTRLEKLKRSYKNGDINKEKFISKVEGWFAYAIWGNTFNLRQKLSKEIKAFLKNTIPRHKKVIKNEIQRTLF